MAVIRAMVKNAKPRFEITLAKCFHGCMFSRCTIWHAHQTHFVWEKSCLSGLQNLLPSDHKRRGWMHMPAWKCRLRQRTETQLNPRVVHDVMRALNRPLLGAWCDNAIFWTERHTKVTSRSHQGHIRVTSRSHRGHIKVTFITSNYACP